MFETTNQQLIAGFTVLTLLIAELLTHWDETARNPTFLKRSKPAARHSI